jgi:hypothetical protein
MRTEVTRVVVYLPPAESQPLELAIDDLREAGRVTGEIELEPADELRVEVELADPEERSGGSLAGGVEAGAE